MTRFEDTTGRNTLVKLSGIKSGRVLDVGMGECACMAFYLANKGFIVTGIDRSPHAVHCARRNAIKKHFKGSFFARRADATKLPFDDNSFDIVVSFHSLHHIARPTVALREMFRVCRPGGKVLISDLNPTGSKLYKHKHNAVSLLASLERKINKFSSSFRTTDTRLDRLFVCTKDK